MNKANTEINDLQLPRQGILGVWDLIVGPGMSVSELWLCLTPTLLATTAVPLYAIKNNLGWNVWQLIIAAIFAFDLVGGAIVNVTPTAKRWHHKAENGFKYHFLFITLHLHPFIIAWLYLEGKLKYSLLIYTYLIIATLIILLSPLYLQKSVVMLLYIGSILLNNYILFPVPGMEWFPAVYFLKLLVSYLPSKSSSTI